MNIGELVLNLGLKGGEKTVGALTNVKKGLGDVASMSLEAKAGIIAAMYALERLFATSGKAGTDLTNFNAITGNSVQTLQQYQYAARQVGVSNQEVEGSFKTLQSTMTKTLLGEGGPKGLARVSLLTGGITSADIQKYAQQPALLIQKLQEYAKKETNIGLRNETLKSFGLGENMVAALSRNAFRPEVLKKAPTYSDKEVGQLDKANIAWANLGNKVEMAVGHFNAMHGGQLVGDISKIIDQVIRLAEAFTKLAEKIHLFEGIGKIFEGWSKIFGGVSDAVDAVSGAMSSPKKQQQLMGSALQTGKDAVGYLGDLGSSFASKVASFAHNVAAPEMKSVASAKPQTNNVQIHNTFAHPGVDPKKTGHSIKQSIEQTYRQMSAQSQGA